jgi:amino acid adenylation domain-containing protein
MKRGAMIAVPGESIGASFWQSSRTHADRLALDIDGRRWTYQALARSAAQLAGFLRTVQRPYPHLVAVLAARSEIAYRGVLGTLLSGAGYVPLNPKFPAERNAHMLAVSGSQTVIVGSECMHQLSDILARVERRLVVICPESESCDALAAEHPRHEFVGSAQLAAAAPVDGPPAVDPGEIAYLLFTSGSTGAPKGVMVSHHNVLAFLRTVWERYAVTEQDRFSQTFDLTFDLSAFDLFACWGRGASLHVVPSSALMAPDEFVRAHELTIWFSVPSVGMMLRDLERLVPESFPSLRVSLFCGERLPATVASAWQQAAPHSVVENLYGPTEATIACTLCRWDAETKSQVMDGTVPIGTPFPGHVVAIVDSARELVATGERGELCIKGPQVSHGYWQDAAKTNDRFVAMSWYSGPDNRWYRTGDIAYINEQGNLIHCGRDDEQIKLRGYRIELAEIEHAVRRVANTSFAVVLPYPSNEEGPTALTAIVSTTDRSEDDILDQVATIVPDYMVPSRVVFLPELPLNANGKIDRKALLQRLRDEDA